MPDQKAYRGGWLCCPVCNKPAIGFVRNGYHLLASHAGQLVNCVNTGCTGSARIAVNAEDGMPYLEEVQPAPLFPRGFRIY